MSSTVMTLCSIVTDLLVEILKKYNFFTILFFFSKKKKKSKQYEDLVTICVLVTAKHA